MSSNKPTVKILTDDVELEPTIDFQTLSNTIVSFVKGSDPKFSVGIYGNWGTGKTTLMKLVEKKLHENNNRKTGKILTIWFNAWRYEREEHYSTIALMKTLAFGMVEHERYKSLTNAIWNGLKIVSKDWFKQLMKEMLVTEEGWEKLETELTDKMRLLSSMERNTIYFDGIKRLEEEFEKIYKNDNDSRILVFVDDLDRCSPKKVLEVLESIKVFLDIRGLVFMIGLSDQTVIKLISKEYEGSGVRGEDYIQKIIQLPIRIPPWNNRDIVKMLEDQIAKKLDKNYADFMIANKELIAAAIQPNPRELKRFVNNVIVALEVYSHLRNIAGGITDDGLLVAEALKTRWFNFYLDLISNQPFRNEIISGFNMRIGMREHIINVREQKNTNMTDPEKKLLEISDDLAYFLDIEKVQNIIKNTADWEVYRKVTSTTNTTQQFELDVEKAAEAYIRGKFGIDEETYERFRTQFSINNTSGKFMVPDGIENEFKRFTRAEAFRKKRNEYMNARRSPRYRK